MLAAWPRAVPAPMARAVAPTGVTVERLSSCWSSRSATWKPSMRRRRAESKLERRLMVRSLRGRGTRNRQVGGAVRAGSNGEGWALLTNVGWVQPTDVTAGLSVGCTHPTRSPRDPQPAGSWRRRSASGRLARTRCRPANSAMASAHRRSSSDSNSPVGSHRCATSRMSGSWARAHTAGAPSDRARRRASARHCTSVRAASRALRSSGLASIRARRLWWERRAVREGMASPRSAERISTGMIRLPLAQGRADVER